MTCEATGERELGEVPIRNVTDVCDPFADTVALRFSAVGDCERPSGGEAVGLAATAVVKVWSVVNSW
jgi:hypothetical protein